MNIGMKAAVAAAALFSAVYGFGAVGDYAKPELNIAVAGEASVAVDRPEMQIDVLPQGSLRLESRSEDVFIRVQPGGAAVLNGRWNDTSWHGKVALWLDASEEGSLEPEKNSAGVAQSVVTDGESGKRGAVIVRWRDRRPEQTEWLGYNDRDTHKNAGGITFPEVMPYVVSNGCNNLNYISLGQHNSGRRIAFIKTIDGKEQTSGGMGGSNSDYQLDAKYVMMVFGSQNGGGNAVIAGKRGTTSLYPRGTVSGSTEPGQSASTSIFAASRRTRLDGVDVDPMRTGLSGGWQVLGFAPNKGVGGLNETVIGLGWCEWGTHGGQNYAEILIFSEMPSEYEIRMAEFYLAKKWGVALRNKLDDGEVRLFGSGSASVELGSVRLGGMFSGDISVAEGAEMVLIDDNEVPAAPAPGMSGWFDPSRDDARVLVQATVGGVKVDRMDKLVNIAAGAEQSPKFDLNSNSRGPAVTQAARGWGAEMMWCDYSTNRLAGVVNGTTLRFNDATDGVDNCLGTKSGFMVLDTTAGGGTPFLDTSVYASAGASVSRYVSPRHIGSPVFSARSGSAFVTNSPAYLNGVPVESGTRGYNARPELLSFGFAETMPIRCFGSWQQSTGYTNNDPEFELRHGEIILYPEVLSERDRRDTEAYLMAKWLGISPSGYGDISRMTVSGAGVVRTANGVMCPKTAAGFAGRLEIAGPTLSFTLGPEAADDAILLPAGRLKTASELTVNLHFASPLESGEYELVAAKEWNEATVALGETAGKAGRAKYSVERAGNRLVLKVVRPGFEIRVK